MESGWMMILVWSRVGNWDDDSCVVDGGTDLDDDSRVVDGGIGVDDDNGAAPT